MKQKIKELIKNNQSEELLKEMYKQDLKELFRYRKIEDYKADNTFDFVIKSCYSNDIQNYFRENWEDIELIRTITQEMIAEKENENGTNN